MRIAIVTLGRFQLLDLARELILAGQDVRLFSGMPKQRLPRFGVPQAVHRPILPRWLSALEQGEGRGMWRQRIDAFAQRVADKNAARHLPRCDVVIGTAGLCVRTLARAQHLGAKMFLECAGHHVLSRKDMLESFPNAQRPAVTHFELKRELAGYNYADVVVVPTRQAADGFRRRGVGAHKIFRNLTGANLEMFAPTARPPLDAPTILYVGRWSVRKGCDVLASAVEGMPWRLVHVGPPGDAPPARLLRFEQRGPLPHWDLRQAYRSADILVHPSLDDCVGTTQIQGVASGLPLVCTDSTGGEDLREFLESPDWVTVVPAGKLLELRQGIVRALDQAKAQEGKRVILGAGREHLSWTSYRARYLAELKRRCEHATDAAS